MTKQKSKKLNNHQRIITILCIAVIMLLAICATFAWFTNKISFVNGRLTIGQLDYTVTVYDKTGTQTFTHNYTTEEDVGAGNDAENTNNWASDACKYKILKVTNASGIGIKPYTSINYTLNGTNVPSTLANYFYYKSIDVTDQVTAAGSVTAFASSYTWPTIATISADGNTFGTIKNNSTLLGTVDDTATRYYIIAYGCYNLPSDYLSNTYSVDVKPILTVAQANGPVPNAAGSSQIYYANSWQTFSKAVSKASDGDTVYLTGSVESPASTNLSLANGVNISLNGYDLTIHGDVAFDYKTTDNRYLTVPAASTLTVDGNLIVKSSGPFTISGSGSSENIILGKIVTVDGNDTVTGGHFYVDCGLSLSEGTDPVTTGSVKEDSGFTLSNISVMTRTAAGGKSVSNLEVSGGYTFIRIGSGAVVNSVVSLATPLSGSGNISDVYVSNFGKVNISIDLSNVSYSGRCKVGAYVKNYNSVTAVYLSANALGCKTYTTSYNTRVINAPGADTQLGSSNVYVGGTAIGTTGSFRSQDVEPYSGSSTELSTVVKTGDNSYTVNLRNTSLAGTESISSLFTQYSYDVTDAKSLKISTYNGIRLSSTQFSNINTNFTNLTSIDLSSAAVQKIGDVSTIPSSAFLNNTHLKSVKFPLTDIAIGANAFQGTAISTVTLGSNVRSIGSQAFDVSGNLTVIWQSASAITTDELQGFDSSKTIIFMDKSLVNVVKDDANYSEAWKLNFYEFYDFKSGDFYCKYSRNGTTTTGCEIIYYAGALSAYDDTANSSGVSMIPDTLSDGTNSFNIIAVNQQAYRKAIIADAGASVVNIKFPAACLTVEDDAFEGTETNLLHANIISLSRVTNIGENAFRYCSISYSSPRSGFDGMTSLGAYAFANTQISGGVVDLHGTSDKSFTPAGYALNSFVFFGSTTSNPYDVGNTSANAYLNLSNCNVIPSNFAEGMVCKADINLSGTTNISSGAFRGTITSDAATVAGMTNVVDISNVANVGTGAFYGVVCKTFIAGCTTTPADNTYISIIGSTGANGIGTFKLVGSMPAVSGTNCLLATADAGDSVLLNNIEITSDVTAVSAGAFSTTATAVGSDNEHLKIGNITVDTRTDNLLIGDNAFKGAYFTKTTAYYLGGVDSEGAESSGGVTTLGAMCFAYSNITAVDFGDNVTQINSSNFLKGCSNLVSIIDTYNGVTTIGDTATASLIANTNLKITVLTDKLLDYIDSASTWYPWRNYFVANEYSGLCDANGTESTSGVYEWSYRVIDPTNTAKGVQIIRFHSSSTSSSYGAITVPLSLNGMAVTEFGGEGNVFAAIGNHTISSLKFVYSIKYIDPDSLDTTQVSSLANISPASSYYYVNNQFLYSYRGSTTSYDLVRVLPSTSRATVAVIAGTVSIKKGALKNCTTVTKVTVKDLLSIIETGAFEGATNLKKFDLSDDTVIISIGDTVFGDARTRVMGDDGYYHYQSKTLAQLEIKVSDTLYSTYMALPSFYMYSSNGNITSASNSATFSVSESALSSTVKDEDNDITIGGINYHVMKNGSTYNNVKYSSDTTDFVAVVTGLTADKVKSKTVIVPSSVISGGISYTVVGIDNAAFAGNTTIEKLVLPDRSIHYSSDAFTSCDNLGYIQFNDVAPFVENSANNTAALPVASSQSLTESSKNDDEN